jgi:hypothetical protein
MCKQTARNVLIKKKGKYLGEELTKTFEKDEEWGLAIFLLHEYYKVSLCSALYIIYLLSCIYHSN